MAEAVACSGSSPCKTLAQDHFLSASIFDGISNNSLVFLLCLFQPDTVQCCGAYGGLKRAAPSLSSSPLVFLAEAKFLHPGRKIGRSYWLLLFESIFHPAVASLRSEAPAPFRGEGCTLRICLLFGLSLWDLQKGEELIKAKHFTIKRTEEGNGRPFV